MPDRPQPEPDTVVLPFIFVPDGEPMPEAVRHFRDPIVLRARFEPALRNGQPTARGIPTATHATALPAPAHLPDEVDRRGITDRIEGAYNVAENGPLSASRPLPSGLLPEQRAALVAEARRWEKAQVPYRYGGRSLSGADCSGAVSAIFKAAGMNIGEISSATLPNSPFFRKLQADAVLEVGDVAWWPGDPGHVAIYAGGLAGEGKDIWTAFNPRGPVFGTSASRYQWGTVSGSAPTWYRFVPPTPGR